MSQKSKLHSFLTGNQVALNGLVIHHPRIAKLVRPRYTSAELEMLRHFLTEEGVFTFSALPNGLFPAAGALSSGHHSGYQYTWVRDNVHVAHAHYVGGEVVAAARTAVALLRFFRKHWQRFEDVIRGDADPAVAMNRPHIRFDGATLKELKQKWPHAQNDALGYFLWLYCKLARQRIVPDDEEDLDCLQLFPAYFQAIEFWKDQDSGHWEEARKVSASSIGTVLAGLREFKMLMIDRKRWAGGQAMSVRWASGLMSRLETMGQASLREILPRESIGPAAQYRRYDAALLFLIYPLEVLDDVQTEQVLGDVITHLQGEHGIRRYLGDSYWCADFDKKMTPKLQTADFSDSTGARDALLHPGEEAQWCIFDPIISVIQGRRFLRLAGLGDDQRAIEALRWQIYYFNRSLGQLTGGGGGTKALRCPEAYYLKKGRYVPNPHTPLLWTQANLWLAMHAMEETVRRLEHGR